MFSTNNDNSRSHLQADCVDDRSVTSVHVAKMFGKNYQLKHEYETRFIQKTTCYTLILLCQFSKLSFASSGTHTQSSQVTLKYLESMHFEFSDLQKHKNITVNKERKCKKPNIRL